MSITMHESPGKPSIQVLLIDDHSLICETMALSFESEGDFKFSMTSSIAEASALIAENGRFDAVLLDYELPGSHGLDGLTKLIEANDGGVALFSGVANTVVAMRALEMGASGFIPKTLPLKTLKHAVRFIADGEVFVPADFAMRQSQGERDDVSLKPREMQVLTLLGEGMPNKEIGRQMNLPETIVKLDVKSISRKLGVNNRTQVVIEARRRGLI